MVLQSYYYTVFAGEQGQCVLNDIKLLLTGVGVDGYEGVDPLLPAQELAVRTATRNAWDMIDGMTQDVTPKRMGFKDLVRETVRMIKYNRGVK
jgi:hypothetical protein